MEGVLASAVDLLSDNQVDAMLGALSVNTPEAVTRFGVPNRDR